MSKVLWTEEAELLLRELWMKGYSAARCSGVLYTQASFRVSRNAVLGKLWRMGFRREDQPKEDKPPEVKRKIEPRLSTPRNTRFVSPTPLPSTFPPDSTWEPLEGVTPVYLCDASSTQCRWPVEVAPDAHFVCGAEKDVVASYCAVHNKMAWTPLTKQQRRMSWVLRAFTL